MTTPTTPSLPPPLPITLPTTPTTTSNKNNNNNNNEPILYIMVIGFHHKKGCQIEYTYPEIGKNESDGSYILPNNWKYLPSLALPDGSHNYDEDYIYFHLINEINSNSQNKSETTTTTTTNINTNNTSDDVNSNGNSNSYETIFGISCFKQINANELQYKDSEVTRTTIQKSVCLLSKLPLYGVLKHKLYAITSAYFQQKNFYETSILKSAYYKLNSQLKQPLTLPSQIIQQNYIDPAQYYIGLNLTDLVVRYQHKLLILFKLLLLERKILFFQSPCSKLSNTIISLISLLPNMIDMNGLNKSSNCLNLNEVNDNYSEITETYLNDLSYSSSNADGCIYVDDENNNNNNKSAGFVKINVSKRLPSASSTVTTTTTTTTTYKNKLFDDSDSHNEDFYLDKLVDDDYYKNDYFMQSKLDLQNLSSSQLSTDSLNKHQVIDASNKEEREQTNKETTSSSIRINNETTPDHDNNNNVNKTANEIKNKVTNLFKFDWIQSPKLQNKNIVTSSPVSQPNTTIPATTPSATTPSATTPSTTTPSTSTSTSTNNKQESNSNEKRSSVDILTLDFGMPLKLYNDNNVLLHPYLSLQYIDYLQNSNKKNNLKGFTIGATNFLFKQRLANEIDAIIEETQIQICNEQLKKELQLTTADLRFADYILKNVNSSLKEKENNDGTNSSWEGSEEWIRINFKWYLYSLLGSIVKSKLTLTNFNTILSTSSSFYTISSNSSSSSTLNSESNINNNNNNNTNSSSNNVMGNNSSSNNTNSSNQQQQQQQQHVLSTDYYVDDYDLTKRELIDDFNIGYVYAFMQTTCFKKWYDDNYERLNDSLQQTYTVTHPFNGQLNINDIRLRLIHTFATTESGRKINKAISEGGKLVSNTGKAVVEGITQAKSTLTSLFNSFSSRSNVLNITK